MPAITALLILLLLVPGTKLAAGEAPAAPVPLIPSSAKPELCAVDAGAIQLAQLPANLKRPYPGLRPAGSGLELVAPRGGCALAQAVVRGPKLSELVLKAPVLATTAGASLPAEAVRLAWLNGDGADRLEATPTRGEVQPLVLIVEVPATATPGTYTGRMAVTGQGLDASLPVSLEVVPWTMPPPDQRQVVVGLIHSPDTIAWQYEVEPWSDAHLKFMEPSLRLLHQVGSRDCTLHLIVGKIILERWSMVRRRGDKPDFTAVDRFLDLWQRICGQPRTVTLYLWENGSDAKETYTADQSVQVTSIRPDGTLENVPAPYYGTPPAKAYWQPVFDGIRSRLTKRGWTSTTVLFGVPWDRQPQEEVIDFCRDLAPDWRWRIFTHGQGVPLPGADGRQIMPSGADVGWMEGVSAIGIRQYAGRGKYPGMVGAAGRTRSHPFTTVNRDMLLPGMPTYVWRLGAALSVGRGANGLSQIGLDFWPVPKGPGTHGTMIKNGISGGDPRHGAARALARAGPAGAEPILSYFALREGLQAAEALLHCRSKKPDAAKTFEDFLYAQSEICTEEPTKRSTEPALVAQELWNQALLTLYRATP